MNGKIFKILPVDKITKCLANKTFGVIVSLVIIFIYYIVKCLKYDKINQSTEYFTKTWLEMSLLFTSIVVFLIFINLLVTIISGLKENLLKNLSQDEANDVKISLFFTFIVNILIFPIILVSFYNKININALQGFIILFAVITYFLDKGLHTRKELLNFDIIIIISLVITLILSISIQKLPYFSFVNKNDFVYGFTTGATAFEVFFAGLFFNTEEYSKEKIFKITHK